MALPSRPALKATARLAAFLALTLPLMPVQALLKRLARPRASTRPRSHTGGEDKPPVPWHAAFPHWYHRQVCRLLGIHVHVDGNVARDGPVLLISNHISWLDIIVLSA
ncbi:MAG: 1-acyl-sn-glycerol-3-phosphate acyltransferase, partial [Pseudomonadota bacterium]